MTLIKVRVGGWFLGQITKFFLFRVQDTLAQKIPHGNFEIRKNRFNAHP